MFHCFGMLQGRENEISLRNSSSGPVYLRALEGAFLTMQCKRTFTKHFVLSTLQRICLVLRQQSQKTLSWRKVKTTIAATARYISITTIYTVRYLRDFQRRALIFK